MTVKEIKEIISTLPDETPVLISAEDVYDANTTIIEYHDDGRKYLILSNVE